MTLSILGRCLQTDRIGVAMVSADPFVGAYGAHFDAGYVCVAQAQAGPAQANKLLAALRTGTTSNDSMHQIVDDASSQRWQLGFLGPLGDGLAFTGKKTFPYSGHVTRDDGLALGNLLSAPDVLVATMDKFEADPNQPLQSRLVTALRAGVQAGGDKRGHRAARLLVRTLAGRIISDIRIDDHPDPITELERLETLEQDRASFGHLLSTVLPLLQRQMLHPSLTLGEALPRLVTSAGEEVAVAKLIHVIAHAQPLSKVSLGDFMTFLGD